MGLNCWKNVMSEYKKKANSLNLTVIEFAFIFYAL